jgi:hypothetical protein
MTFYPVGASHWLRDGSISREENERCSWSVRFFPIFARFELLTEKKKLISKFQEKVAEREKKNRSRLISRKKNCNQKGKECHFARKRSSFFFFFCNLTLLRASRISRQSRSQSARERGKTKQNKKS